MIIEEISTQTSFDFAVVEISSYQMEFPFGFAPKVGVILNLTPDHLARHKTMDVYAQMKKRIFAAQSRDDFCLYPFKNTMLHPDSPKSQPILLCEKKPKESMEQHMGGGYIYVDESSDRETQIICVSENNSKSVYSVPPLQLLGRHNLQNIQAVIGILHSLSLPVESHLLSSIRPLEHRLEIIDGGQQDDNRCNNVEWINDSKATNVEATMAGLSATIEYIQRKSSPVTLIILLGGAGKEGAEYRMLLNCITNVEQQSISIQILCFGESGREIQNQLQEGLRTVEKTETKTSHETGIHIQYVPTMYETVSLCHSIVNSQHVQNQRRTILLSPACASFDEFQNFEHRGRIFCELVQNIPKRKNNTTKNTNTTSTTIRLEET
jgi:UDP-N-acetylmuramoylalanine--D-glutamate ligase